MIWDVQFDGYDLIMCNMFCQLKLVVEVVVMYGCFVFYFGLLVNGCLLLEDIYLLYGEMFCVVMDDVWLELEGDSLCVIGCYEYVMGFGYYYQV